MFYSNFLFRKKSLPKDLRSKISSEVIKIKTEKGEEEKKAAARRKRENEADQVLYIIIKNLVKSQCVFYIVSDLTIFLLNFSAKRKRNCARPAGDNEANGELTGMTRMTAGADVNKKGTYV